VVEPAAEGPADPSVGGRLAVRARELATKGAAVAGDLPSGKRLAGLSPGERKARLEKLRVDLYAISSVLAEAAVARALADRPNRPPYGLVRSGHTDWRMVLDTPTTVEEGTVAGFYELGKLYVDTTVFHLHKELSDLPHGERGWMLTRLEALLALFRAEAGPAGKARMRDAVSFIYGGLHFGTGVSVQLAEVMHRLLSERGLEPEAQAEVMARSSRPAMRFAALNLDHVIVAYHAFLAPASFPGGPQWFDGQRFVVTERDGRPWSVDVHPDHLVAGKPHVERIGSVRPTWATHGCPARVSPSGGQPPIHDLWSWAVDLALATGLLGQPEGHTPAP
jgi:hypothetical protein